MKQLTKVEYTAQYNVHMSNQLDRLALVQNLVNHPKQTMSELFQEFEIPASQSWHFSKYMANTELDCDKIYRLYKLDDQDGHKYGMELIGNVENGAHHYGESGNAVSEHFVLEDVAGEDGKLDIMLAAESLARQLYDNTNKNTHTSSSLFETGSTCTVNPSTRTIRTR